MMLTTEDLRTLKEKLPRGYFGKLKKMTGLADGTIASFLNGKRYRQDIHEAAIRLAEEEQRKIAVLKKRQRSLGN